MYRHVLTITMKAVVILVVVLGIISVSSCEIFFDGDGTSNVDEFVQPWGKVVNAKTGTGIAAADVELTAVDNSSVTYSVNADSGGYFDYADAADGEKPEYGDYVLTASMNGYVFAEKRVSLSGLDQDLGQIIGFPYDETEDAGTLTIATIWDDNFNDVDVHVTYPNGWKGQNTLIEPYTVMDSYDGFEPFTSGRETVYWQNKTSDALLSEVGFPGDNRACIELDVDDRNGGGPETISIRAIPFDWYTRGPDYNITATGANRLPGGHTYAWLGVLELYVHGFSAVLQEEGEYLGAEVEIYVFSGNEFKGLFTLPRYTDINAASVLRINLLARDDAVDFYQITPDIRLLNQYAPGDVPAFKGIFEYDVLHAAGVVRN